jgi:pimeloyl-ACP methyl ester carboxylesterase
MRLLALGVLTACSDPNDDVPDGWEACPLSVDKEGRRPAQCATIDVPLDWDDPEGPTIEVYAKRRLGQADARDKQVWMLAGGPGQPASVYDFFVPDLEDLDPTVDWYLMDHRGVGHSTRLGCAAEDDDSDGGLDITDAEWPDCLAEVQAGWGDGLQHFTTTAAARDLEAWMTHADADQDVFVYGGSYGTTLAHRFLQVFPDRVDGVVLDSVAVDVDHRVYDAEFDGVGGAFLDDLCAADEACSDHLGSTPSSRARDIVRAVDEGHCSEAIDGDTLRNGLAAFLPDASLRGFVPALLWRAERCDEEDRADLERLISLFTDREPHYTEREHSDVLFANIELSEQWPEPWPTLEEVEQDYADAVFSFGIGPAQRPLLDIWPRYSDPLTGQIAVTDTPILVLQGGMDPQTPPWRTEPLAEAWDGPGQHYVAFPEGGHILVGSTRAGGEDCASRLVLDFFADPGTAPDDSCVADVEPVRFEGEILKSKLLLGAWDRYDDPGCGCASGRSPGWLALLVLAPVIGRRRRAG